MSTFVRVITALVAAAFVACTPEGNQEPAEGFGTDRSAATVGSSFIDQQYAGGLTGPTAMAFAPDGRLFVCEQSGSLRVIKNGSLLSTPFLTLPVNSAGERGLLGVAFDPSFASNAHVYVYYTATSPTLHNRLSRFTANGDVAVPGSEVIILELDNLSSASNHNGGAIHFGPDGKLYIGVGDNANSSNSQSLSTLHGKMLRINKDGTIPTDNPFYSSTSGKYRAIWALGLRNPFTFAIHPTTGRMLINDVGQYTWEEIDEGIAGSNYGWPTTEGYTSDSRFRSPNLAYPHSGGQFSGCAIAGGVFYTPSNPAYPSDYVGDYFFADYCSGWIQRMDVGNNNAFSTFASNIYFPVDVAVGPDGVLYYLSRNGRVYRIVYSGTQPTPPSITSHPSSQTVSIGQSATFACSATGSTPLSYQWQRNSSNISGATGSSYTLASPTTSDSGASFRCVVSNPYGNAASNGATLTVTSNQPPVASIATPSASLLYSSGETVSFSGSANDPEQGALPASALTWRVDFHHDTHSHPFMSDTSGIASGSFTVPTSGEASANTWFRIYLTAKDASGASHTITREIHPRTARMTFQTSPAGLQLTLDGQPFTSPSTVTGVVGYVRAVSAPSPQTVNGVTYTLSSWSDGGAASHSITTPASDQTYTAVFTAQTAPAITSHPVSRTVTAGQSASFSCAANGTAPLQYQWQRNGSNLSGATSSSYTLASTTSGDSGASFRCVVSNAYGSATSNSATLTVTSTSPSAFMTINYVSSGQRYLMSSAVLGNRMFIDRSYVLTHLSPALQGAAMVRGANYDKYITNPAHLTFTLSQPATLYVAFDFHTTLPAWLNDGTWTLTNEVFVGESNMPSNDGRRVFKKDVPAGQMTLGGNLAAPATNPIMCYTLLAVPR